MIYHHWVFEPRQTNDDDKAVRGVWGYPSKKTTTMNKAWGVGGSLESAGGDETTRPGLCDTKSLEPTSRAQGALMMGRL